MHPGYNIHTVDVGTTIENFDEFTVTHHSNSVGNVHNDVDFVGYEDAGFTILRDLSNEVDDFVRPRRGNLRSWFV